MTTGSLKLLTQWALRTQVFGAPTGETPTHHALLIYSLKLSFIFIFSIAEVHWLWFTVARVAPRACSIRAWVIPVPTKSCGLKVVLGIQSDAHRLLEGNRMYPENLGSGNASTQTFHEDGHMDCLR
jgi:hypothetical protein